MTSNLQFCRTPASKPERVADDNQIGKSHRKRREDGAHEAQHCQRYARGIVKEGPEEVLLDRPQGRLRESERLGHRLNVRPQEKDVRRFARDIAGRAHRYSEVRLLQSRGVIDAVTDKRHPGSLPLEFREDTGFGLGPDFRKNIRFENSQLRRDGDCRGAVVSCDEADTFMAGSKRFHNVFRLRLELVLQCEDREQAVIQRQSQDGRTARGPFSSELLARNGAYARLSGGGFAPVLVN